MLANAIDIPHWLRSDRDRPYDERLARDRAIGAGIASTSDAVRLEIWWRAIASEAGIGAKVERARGVAGAIVLLLGIVVGVSVTGLAMTYDGAHPVNLLTLIALTVGIPTLLLVANIVLIAGRAFGGTSILAALNLGQWIGVWLDRWIGAQTPVFAWSRSRRRAGAQFAVWQVATWSQWSGTGFFIGAIAATVTLAAFTDLAFGWSTTLNVSAQALASVVDVVSAPWAHWFPAAAPDAVMVEQSRYFRLGESDIGEPEVLGRWWLFYVAVLGVYGLVPRLVFLAVGLWRTRAATRRLLLDDPEVTALLDRMRARVAVSSSTAAQSESAPETPARSARIAGASSTERAAVIVWNDAVDTDAASAFVDGAEILRLDAGVSFDAERAALGGLGGGLERVLVLTKGYEAPIRDFFDFVRRVREAVGSDASIQIVPLGLDGASVRDADVRIWRRALGEIDDPRLYVAEVDA